MKRSQKMGKILNHFRFTPFDTIDDGITTITNYLQSNLSEEQKEMIGLALIIKEYDYDTFIHSLEVAILNYEISKQYHPLKETHINLFFGGLIHDCGKISFSENLFRGTQALSIQEQESIKNHTILGYTLAKFITKNPLILQLVYEHHENLEGTGYPRGKSDVDAYTQTIAISDIFSALTMNRNYRKKRSHTFTEAITELEKMKAKVNQATVDILKDLVTEKKKVAL